MREQNYCPHDDPADFSYVIQVKENASDVDLLKEINQRAPSVTFFSLISAPDSPSYERVRQMDLRPGAAHGKAVLGDKLDGFCKP